MGALPIVSEVWPGYERVNVQVGLERWLAEEGRSHRLFGVTGHAFSLTDVLHERQWRNCRVGNVQMISRPIDADGSTHACVEHSVYFVHDGPARLAMWLRTQRISRKGAFVR